MKTSSILRSFPCVLVMCIPLAAHADTLLFNLSPTNGTTTRSAGSAPAQGVIVGTTTTITSFSLYVDTPAAENLKFFIDNGTGTSVLFSRIETAAASSTPAWISTGPLSFTLTAGQEYFFGVVGDGATTDIGFIFPTTVYSANGLTADSTGNQNVTTFANPITNGGMASAEIGLQLYGAGNAVTTTPEPSSLMLLGTGALGVLGAARRRFSAKR